MALTVNTQYARFLIDSIVDDVTIKVKSVTGTALGSSWVSRKFIVASSTSPATGQVREITAVDTGASTITLEYPWRKSLTDPLVLATKGAAIEVDPQVDDVCYVNYYLDDLDDGVNIIKSENQYTFDQKVTLDNTFVYDSNRFIVIKNATTTTSTLAVNIGAHLQLGTLSEGGLGYGGGGLRFSLSSSSTVTLLGTGNGGDCGNIFIYGCNMSAIGGAGFYRCYRGSTQIVRMVDINIRGEIGGRAQGTKSFILNYKGARYTEDIGLISSASPFGGFFNITAHDSAQGVYHNGQAGGGPATYRNVETNNVTQSVRITETDASNSPTLIDCSLDESSPIASWNASSLATLTVKNSLVATSLSGTEIQAGGRLWIKDLVDAEIYNSVSISGTYDDIPDLFRCIMTDGQTAYSQGTQKTPHFFRYRRYGSTEVSGSYKATSPNGTLAIPDVTDPRITLSEVNAGLLTGISVDMGIGEIDVTENHGITDIYDYVAYSATISGNMQYDNPLSKTVVELDLGDWDLHVDGSVVTGNITTTGDITFANDGSIDGIYTDASGTYLPFAVTNIDPLDSIIRIQVYNETTSMECCNSVISGSAYTGTFLEGDQFSIGDTVRVRIVANSGITAKAEYEGKTTVSSAGWSINADQEECSVYNTNGIDGSTVTEFSADYPNIEIDVSDGDGTTSVKRLFAWWKYNLTTEEGIRNYFGGLLPDDLVNYRINVDIVDLHLDNTEATPVMVIDGRLYRSDETTVITPTGGSIQMDPDKVYSIESKSPITEQDKQDIAVASRVKIEEAGGKLDKIEKRTRIIPVIFSKP